MVDSLEASDISAEYVVSGDVPRVWHSVTLFGSDGDPLLCIEDPKSLTAALSDACAELGVRYSIALAETGEA